MGDREIELSAHEQRRYLTLPSRVVDLNAVASAGRVLLAVPMLVYPVLHFVYRDGVASIVPPWIPWHLFWTYFTAVTIFAAGICILSGRTAFWPTALLGLEILLFVILIHVPLLLDRPTDSWAHRELFGTMPGRIVNAFKDFGLSGAVFLLAGTQTRRWRAERRNPLFVLGVAIIITSMCGFGFVHFLFPQFAPGIPPMQASIAFLFPGRLFCVYFTGAAFLIGAFLIAARRCVREAAIGLVALIAFFEIAIWLPVFVAHPAELTGNWLKDLGIAGGLLLLATQVHSGKDRYALTPQPDFRQA